MVRPCTCASPFQDREYGKGLRVFNECRPASGKGGDDARKAWRCTVCGRTEGK